MHWRAVGLAAALLVWLVSSGCSNGSARPSSQFLSIATGGTGGVYYPYGGGLAKVLNDGLPNVRATAEVTAASVDNLKLIRDGRADIAFALADTLADAVGGRGAFAGRAVPAASLAVLYSNYTQLVTLGSSDIRRVADLRGRTVSTGSPGSGTEVTALRLLARGRARSTARRATPGAGRIGVGRRAEGRQARRVLLERRAADGCRAGSLAQPRHNDPAGAERGPADRTAPGLRRCCISSCPFRQAHIRRLVSAVPVVGVANVLVVNQAMSDDLAYDITRLLFERQPELAAIHPEARNLSIASRRQGLARGVSSRRPPLLPRQGSPPIEASDEAPQRRLTGLPARLTTGLAIGLSLYSLYWVLFVVQPQLYRVSFLLVTLVLTFLVVPARATRTRPASRRSTGCSPR